MTRHDRSKNVTPRWVGGIDRCEAGLVQGWAVDTQNPEARVVLELCLDGEPLICIVADAAHNDFLRLLSAEATDTAPFDNCHGFVSELGSIIGAIATNGRELTVKVANTDVVLVGRAEIGISDSIKPTTRSKVYGDGSLRLHGWALDPMDAGRSIAVRAFIGSREIAVAVAGLRTPTTRSLDVDPHGFVLDLPFDLADGFKHIVRVVDGDGEPLEGSPIFVCCYTGGARYLLENAEVDEANLLTNVIESYEHFLPRGAGLKHYREWASEFENSTQKDTPIPSEMGSKTFRIAFVVTGDASDSAYSRTRASLNAQHGMQVKIFQQKQPTKDTIEFSALLHQALSSESDFLACVRAGDTLPEQAAMLVASGFASSDVQLVYTDSETANRPWFKPAWNPEYALGSDYPLELLVMRVGSVQSHIAKHDVPFDAYDLAWSMLTKYWKQGTTAIVHVPHVLYIFRSSFTENELLARMRYASRAIKIVEPTASLNPHVKAISNSDEHLATRRVVRSLSRKALEKTVSLIIPTRDQAEMLERCISSLQRFTLWPRLEILVIDNDSVQTKTKSYFRKLSKQGVKVLSYPGSFNFSAINNHAVNAANGEIVGLINNDIEALHEGWLEEMLSHLMSPGVGAVGAKLLWPNGMVQHGGVLLGMGNVAGHFGNLLADTDWGDHGRNQLVQQVSAVTAACLLIRKRDYLAVGGLDERAFPVAFNDVDLCLKLRKKGKTIVWTPHAQLLHAESASRGKEDTPQKRARAQREIDQLRLRWGSTLLRDPAYHPSLSLDSSSHAFGALALPPRKRLPRTAGIFEEPSTLNELPLL